MKRVLAIFLALALCLSCLPATAFAAATVDSGTCGENLTWVLTDDGTLTISGTGSMTNYEDEGNTPPWASYRNQIYSVAVEDGVTGIGNCAFWGCSNLTDITIPDSVTSIGGAVFANCSNLTEIAIPEGVTEILSSTFRNCSSLEQINIPENVVSIGDVAFRGCTSLTDITISDSVTNIGVAAFDDCGSLSGIWVSENNPNYCSENGVLFNKEKTTLIQAPGGMQGEYVIPDSVTIIDHCAFSGCSSLTSVMIPDSVNSLGGSVFSGCSSLTEITIPESVTSLGGGVFHGCSSLTDITLPASITEIPNAAFDSCSSLESITIPDSVTEISWGAFEDCISLTSITIPESVTKMGNSVFRGCSGLKSITIPESVTDIGQEVFSGCSSLESITIPESVTSIGSFWFEDCISLTSITIPDSVTSIGYAAFDGCISLTSITIPESVTSIGGSAFYGCSSLTGITIPSGVTSIDYMAFDACSSLTSITIPAGVTNIGDGAFSECSSLNGIWVSESNPNYSSDEQGVLFDKEKTELRQAPAGMAGEYTIPVGVTDIGNYAFYGCSNLSGITIPESVTDVSDWAFAECYNLESVTIPTGVTSIGEQAFRDCRSLISVTFTGDAPSFGAYVFNFIAVTAYYPADNATWTSDVMLDYGGTITWEAYTPAQEIVSGECGENLTWVLTDGTLTISGTGAMGDFEENEVPWYSYRSSITAVEISDGVTSISRHAFYRCSSLTSATIPDSINSIGSNAFNGCIGLSSVTIPASVTEIGAYVFANCSSLNGIWVDEGNPNYSSDASGVLFNKDKTELIQAPGGIQGEYTIPDSVTRIVYYAFASCSSLTNIAIPNSVTSIDDYAFYFCSNLTSVTIPNSITSIGHGTFWGCSSLISITIPASVTSIRSAVFESCSSLTEIIFIGDAPTFNDNAFSNVTATAYYPADNATWTEDVMLDYGGTITWVALGEIIGMELLSEPNTTSYAVGESLDLSGLHVAIVDENGTQLTIATESLTVSDVDMTTTGAKTVTVSYEGWSVSFAIYVHSGRAEQTLDPSTYPESAHNYTDSMDETQTIFCDGASSITLTFSQETEVESGWDFIYIYDSNDNQIAAYTGTEAAGVTVTVPGNTAKIRLTSDGSVNGYGYSFSSITAYSVIHTGTTVIEGVEATCTEAGRTDGIICEICGQSANCETIPALGHDYEDVVTEATPEANGYTTHTCTRCGDSYVDSFTNYGAIASGTCGENLTWVLTDDGTLTISGTGAMDDFESDTMPWYSYLSSITAVEIADGVTGIGGYAFNSCTNLTSVTIPGSLTRIGYAAFADCSSLTSITIPASVTEIGSGAFRSCSSLNGIWVDEGNPNYSSNTSGVLFNKEKTELIQAPGGIQGEYTIPDSVTRIGNRSLYNCSSLTSVTIPGSVTSIGLEAFYGCSSLTSVTIPASVTGIGDFAFNYCNSLTSITIPASVTSIGFRAFVYCSSLNAITVDEGNSNYSSDASGVLFNKDKTELMQAPGGTQGEYCIPDSVTSVDSSAFFGCSSLTSITIPDGVTSIGSHAFYDCSSLTSVTIPNSVTSIGDCAFAYCSSLTSVTIPDSITRIDEWTFGFCHSLTSIAIPASVTSIVSAAFESCSSLTEITFKGNAPQISSDAFYRVTATAYYPADNATWTSDVMRNYGGTITWEAYRHTHTWSEWTVTAEPTCTEEGERVHTCTDCGETETQVMDALGHVYDAVVTAPTCTERGYTTYTCVDGDDSYVDDYVNALGHDTEVQNQKDATCTEAGYTGDEVCTVCDEIVEQGETIDALDHVYDAVVTAPTCTKQGYTTHTCTRCGDSYVDSYVDATGHTGEWIDDGDGTAHRVCTICGVTENKVSTNGGEVSVDVPSTLAGTTDVEVEHVADTSDERYSQVEDTISEEEEGTVQKVFDINLKDEDGENVQPGNETVTVKLPIEESSDDTEYKVYRVNDDRTTTDMNAQQQGNCMVFETDHFSLYVVVKHTHDYDTVKTAPTCTERGYTTYTCSTCDDSYVDDYVKATGHSFGGWTVTTDPTCTEKGVETGCCAHCDATEIRSVKALGHDLSAATCTEDAKCRREGCDHTEEGTALGHSFTSYRSNNDAGCTTDGTKTAECRRCHDADTVVDKGSAKGHDYAKTWSKGQDGHWHECSVCRDKTDVADHDYGTAGDKCVVCEYQRDHVHRLSLVPAVAADCTTAGNKAYYTCSGCDDWFEDANGSELIEDHNSVIIAELGHKTELQGVKEATCTEDGYTGDQVCTACGETVVKGKTIDALGHDMADATCTEAAKCQRESCDHTEGTALGHQWDDGVVTTEPTEEAEGVKTYTCERCGVTQTESIPALEPTEPEEPTEPSVPSTPVKPVWQSWLEKIFGDWWGDEEEECDHEYASVITEPTCEEKGYTTHTCTKCGDTYKDSYTDALGHQYEDGICTQCGKTEPVKPAKPNWKDILDKLLEWWK